MVASKPTLIVHNNKKTTPIVMLFACYIIVGLHIGLVAFFIYYYYRAYTPCPEKRNNIILFITFQIQTYRSNFGNNIRVVFQNYYCNEYSPHLINVVTLQCKIGLYHNWEKCKKTIIVFKFARLKKWSITTLCGILLEEVY